MSGGNVRSARDGDAYPERGESIDELLDRAVAAINCGDRVAASALAGQVLAVDVGNAEAEDLLAAPGDEGEIRRLTIMFADLGDSTVLSTRVEPETYRLLVGRYRDLVLGIVNRYEGHVGSTQGDGLLAVFGHPTAHEDDVRRAVLAGLEITRLSAQASPSNWTGRPPRTASPQTTRRTNQTRNTRRATVGASTVLSAAQIPVLAIIGRDESLHDGPKMAVRFRQRLPEARIEVIDDANHLIPVDQPEIVEKLLADFMH